VLLCSALLAVFVGADHARAAAIYSGSTEASGIRLSINDPGIVPLLTGGGTDISSPLAQTTADSFGRARALASLAYPGDDIAGLSTFLGVALPPSVPRGDLPAYPLTVIADETTPQPDAVTSPGYDLRAEVASARTTSSASAGASPVLSPGGNTTAGGTVASTGDGGLVAEARSSTTGFQLAGLVSLGTLTTTATATRSASGALVRRSSMDLTAASVAGLPLALRDGKLVVPVLGNALDVNEAIQTLPVLAPLREQGLTLSVQAAQQTPNGIIAPGLRVTLVRDLPSLPLPSVPLPQLLPQQPQVGPLPASTLTVVYTVGYANATAALSPLPSFSASHPTAGPGAAPVMPGSATALPASPAVSLTGSAATGGLAATAPDGASAPSVAEPEPVLARLSHRVPLDIADLYLAIALAALSALALGQLVRHVGIRTGATAS
jgi:hypothetical protein